MSELLTQIMSGQSKIVRKQRIAPKLELFSNGDPVHINQFLSRMIGILGITGSGKTNTAAVFIEELIKFNTPMLIFDTEGDYITLRELFPAVNVAGLGDDYEIQLRPETWKTIAVQSYLHNIPVVMDLASMPEGINKGKIMMECIDAILKVARVQKHKYTPRPYMFFVDEAHLYIPQSVGGFKDSNSKLKDKFTFVAKQGRKYGIGLVIASQRPQDLDKKVLSQARVYVFHRTTYPLDIDVYKNLLPLENEVIKNRVPELVDGECLFLLNNDVYRFMVRLRHTMHPSGTPGSEFLTNFGTVAEAKEDFKEFDRDGVLLRV